MITCEGSVIDDDDINLQREHIGNISIAYKNIAILKGDDRRAMDR